MVHTRIIIYLNSKAEWVIILAAQMKENTEYHCNVNSFHFCIVDTKYLHISKGLLLEVFVNCGLARKCKVLSNSERF